jgi:2-dehydro-3-deoxygalactonokinase
MFSLMSKHSILVHAVEPGGPAAADGPPFRAGLAAAKAAPDALTASLFRIRAAQLLGFERRADGAARLSGLLIGAEIAAVVRRHGKLQPLQLIAAGALGELYQAALAGAGISVTTVDAEQASRLGLCRAARRIWGGTVQR